MATTDEVEGARAHDGLCQSVTQEPSLSRVVSETLDVDAVEVEFCDLVLLKSAADISVSAEGEDAGTGAGDQDMDTGLIDRFPRGGVATNVADDAPADWWAAGK